MPHTSFGIATAPQQVDYPDLLRVWRDADTVPEIESGFSGVPSGFANIKSRSTR